MCSIMGFCDRGVTVSEFKRFFDRTISRGPDDSRIIDTGKGLLGFHRLAIMGLTSGRNAALRAGRQLCGLQRRDLRLRPAEKEADGDGKYTFVSESDCEILLPMYKEYGTDMFRHAGCGVCLDPLRRRHAAATSPPVTPSAFVPCTTATTATASSSLPANPRTWWGWWARSCPSLPDTTIRTGNSSATATSPQ